MSSIFLYFANISITATWVVLVLVVLRPVLKKVPKWVSCILWGVVGLRLILPINFESNFSLIPSKETIPTDIAYLTYPQIDSGVSVINNVVNPVLSDSVSLEPLSSVNTLETPLNIFTVVWVFGVLLMFIYSFVSFVYLKIKVLASVKSFNEKNVFFCDNIKSPFILGFIKPKIYVPSGLNEQDLKFVLEHENSHLKRKDHIIKPISFFALSVYWFNPAIWLWYVLLCRDIESACDENVIKSYTTSYKKLYSEALLNCSSPKRMVMACPVAFGEVGVKNRIKSVLNYKKPAFWVVVVAFVCTLLFTICFITNPYNRKFNNILNENGYEILYSEPSHISMFFMADNISQYVTEEGKNITNILKAPLETENGAEIYLESVESFPEKDEVYLTFSVSHTNLSDEGIVTTPYIKTENGYDYFLKLGSKVSFSDVTGDGTSCNGEIVSVGPKNEFVISVKKSWLENRRDCKISVGFNMGEIGYQRKTDNYDLSETQDNLIVSEIKNRYLTDAKENAFWCTNYKIVNEEKSQNATKLYMWVLWQEYYVSDFTGKLTLYRSKHVPIVITINNDNGSPIVSEYVDFSQEIQFNSELKNKFSNKNSSRNYLKLQIAKCLDKAKENFNVTETTVLEILSWHENNDSDFYCLCICGEEYEVALNNSWEFDGDIATKNSRNPQTAKIAKSDKSFDELYQKSKELYEASASNNAIWIENIGTAKKYAVKNEIFFVDYSDNLIKIKIGFETEKADVFEVDIEIINNENKTFDEQEHLEFYNSIFIK
jgi:beta-lactamase regulating signal transducer with metallopeptidase domain